MALRGVAAVSARRQMSLISHSGCQTEQGRARREKRGRGLTEVGQVESATLCRF